MPRFGAARIMAADRAVTNTTTGWCSSTSSDSHRCCHRHRRKPPGGSAVAELAVVVVAPAIGPALGGRATGVTIAGAELGQGEVAGDEPGRQGAGGGSVAKLASGVGPPAGALARQREGTGIELARARIVIAAGSSELHGLEIGCLGAVYDSSKAYHSPT